MASSAGRQPLITNEEYRALFRERFEKMTENIESIRQDFGELFTMTSTLVRETLPRLEERHTSLLRRVSQLEEKQERQNILIDELLHRFERNSLPGEISGRPLTSTQILSPPHVIPPLPLPAPAPSPPAPPVLVPPTPTPETAPASEECLEKLKRIHDQIRDQDCSKSIVISNTDLASVLQNRLNNSHRILGKFVPTIKRALHILGLEELTWTAVKYKLFPSGALRITYQSPCEARRSLHFLRGCSGQSKANARQRLDTETYRHSNEELFNLDPEYRMMRLMRFSLDIPGHYQGDRDLLSKLAKLLKARGETKSWECLIIKDSLVLKCVDRRKRATFYTTDEARLICEEATRLRQRTPERAREE